MNWLLDNIVCLVSAISVVLFLTTLRPSMPKPKPRKPVTYPRVIGWIDGYTIVEVSPMVYQQWDTEE